jgi:NitT/TauT family transport system permease protein
MNAVRRNLLGTARAGGRVLHAGDVLIIVGLVALLYAGLRLASPTPVAGPEIDLSPSALPNYALLSLMRMAASYILSLAFALVYGYVAAHNRSAERVMLPILDVLQSVPLLSFLPVVLLVLTTVLPTGLGVEASAVVLIFTGQAWNIVYSFHQSVKTVPRELQEASANFRLNWWYRLRYMELPFSVLGLLWNSIVSWANGWFFLMAAETFRVGERDFRLLGLGSYLQAAADAGDGRAIIFGFITLVLMVVLLDQLLWQPLLAWAEKFRTDLVENDNPPVSWFYNLISGSRLLDWFNRKGVTPLVERLDRRLGGVPKTHQAEKLSLWQVIRQLILSRLLPLAFVGWLAYLAIQAAQALISLPLPAWGQIAVSTLASAGRVFVATILGLLWTVPVGVWIGTNPRLSNRLQPIIQSIAAVPATAFFAVLVAYMVALPFGLDSAAILLMMLGTQWYLLFNIIAGANALPQELMDVSKMFRINGVDRWRTLILPALLPYMITGLNIAGGGAWNASIVAEYTQYKGQTYSVIGLGSLISQSTAAGDFRMLMAATLTMIVTVIAVNYFVWQRLHRFVQEKYRLD